MKNTRFSSLWALTLVLTLLATLAPGVSAQEGASRTVESTATEIEFDLSGPWETTFGTMTLQRTERGYSGNYMGGSATIDGSLDGQIFTFTYREPTVTGRGSFHIASDGLSFRGTWKENERSGSGEWIGKRESLPALPSFAGLWETSYGRMRLAIEGEHAHGTYLFAGQSRIEGKIDGRRLIFDYEQPDGEKGSGVFELSKDGSLFTGEWKAVGGRGNSRWSGTRVVPEPGKVWLVILEANWESGLHSSEYSYGSMLRSFFTRAPQVQVRHRFVNDIADLERWCAEVPFLVEPVVLYLSSHGTETGINLGAESAKADDLIGALADIPTLRLLHFGSCSVMSGQVPARITAARPASSRFPISGFTLPADWAGSALVDFTYLELVLARGMTPRNALDATLQMVSFANEESNGPISGSGLTIFEPEALLEATAEVTEASSTRGSSPIEIK